jgi:hypothetical protein
MALVLKIMELMQTMVCEASTTSTTIYYTDHDLTQYDRIINLNRLEYGFIPAPREVLTVPATNRFTVLSVPSQAAGDELKAFHYVDRTSYLKVDSLSIQLKNDHMDTASFTLVSTEGEWSPKPGQQVRISDGSDLYFGGFISEITKTRPGVGITDDATLYMDITCDSFNSLPSRRTITMSAQQDVTAETIVEQMVDDFLYQEGVYKGTIDTGATLEEYPSDTSYKSMSIKQVLDDVANSSGFKWYINAEKELTFVQEDSITESTQDIIDGGAFTGYFNVTVNESLDDYVNRQFVIGGAVADYGGNMAEANSTNYDAVSTQQYIEGGTGVYGNILSTADLSKTEMVAAEAGTDTDTLNITSHGLVVGDCIFNLTGNAFGQVKTVNSDDQVTLEIPITDQAEDDTILYWLDINAVLRNCLKRQSLIPRRLTFDSLTLNWRPAQRVDVTLNAFGISTKKFLIETVTLSDFNGDILKASVECVERNADDWSTQSIGDWVSFFEQLVANANATGKGYGIKEIKFVQSTTPTATKLHDLWIKTAS